MFITSNTFICAWIRLHSHQIWRRVAAFPFILNETHCGTAAMVVDGWYVDDFCHRFVWHLKLRLLIPPLGNLTPVQLSELQDTTVIIMPNCHATVPAFVAASDLSWMQSKADGGCYCQPCIHFVKSEGHAGFMLSRHPKVLRPSHGVRVGSQGQILVSQFRVSYWIRLTTRE